MRVTVAELRTCIQHALVVELHHNDAFMSLLRGSGIGKQEPDSDGLASRELADEWLEELAEAGEHLAAGHQAQVYRFVARRWPGLVLRFRGDERAARMTLHNLLDTKFNALKVGG